MALKKKEKVGNKRKTKNDKERKATKKMWFLNHRILRTEDMFLRISVEVNPKTDSKIKEKYCYYFNFLDEVLLIIINFSFILNKILGKKFGN